MTTTFKMVALNIINKIKNIWLMIDFEKSVIQGCFLSNFINVSGFELFLGYFGVLYSTTGYTDNK